MKIQTGSILIKLLVILWIGLSLGAWIWNANKLASCDFKAPYMCEIIHNVGLILPPIAIITVWFDID